MDCGSKPLVSFCLKSYNQKEYLKDALEGAFAQTYRPLEIVISDDASTDGRADLILAHARQWNDGVDGVVEHDAERNCDVARFAGVGRNGVTAVVLLNKSNLGNLGNWQRICEFAKGDLFVKADGDDVSLPARTEKIAEAWVKDGKSALIVAHRGYKMDCKGRVYGEMDMTHIGAVMAYNRRLYDEFDFVPTGDRLVFDDYVYAMRKKMLGGKTLGLDARLVQYRYGSGASTSMRGYRRIMAKSFRHMMASYEYSAAEARARGIMLSPPIDRLDDLIKLWSGRTFRERWVGFRKLGIWRASPVRVKALLLLLLSGRFADPILDASKILKYKYDLVRWRMRKNIPCEA